MQHGDADRYVQEGGRNSLFDPLLLGIGYGGLLVGVLVAHLSPANGYEISLFTFTPLGVWAGLAVAYLSAAIVSVQTSRTHHGRLALLLGGMTTLTVVAMPLLRGYRFFGQADSLTHLGWVRDFAADRMSFFELFYPGTHTISVFYAETFALPTETASLLMLVTFAGLYLLFIPLVVRALTGDRRATIFASFSGFFLLPITNVSSGLYYHTFTLGTFFFPVFLFLLVRYVVEPTPTLGGVVRLSSNAVVLVLTGLALVWFHPQVTLNVLILLAAINGLYLFGRLRAPAGGLFGREASPGARDVLDSGKRATSGVIRPSFLVLAVLVVAWVVWISQFGKAFGVGERVLRAVEGMIYGTGEVGSTVQSRGDSASAVGGSVPELFLKLFLVSSVYTAAAIGTVVASIRSRGRIDPTIRSIVVSFGFATAVLVPFFFAHFLGNISHLFFRHVAFGLVLATVFGAVGLSWASGGLRKRFSAGSVRTVGIAVLAIALVLSLAVAFPSPYIFLQNHHVSNYEYEGYESAFAHGDESLAFSGIRRGPYRYSDALVPGPRWSTIDAVTREEIRANPAAVRDGEFYLPVSKTDRDREVIAYRELRYTDEELASLDGKPGVHRVQTNGEFTLYYVDGDRLEGEVPGGE